MSRKPARVPTRTRATRARATRARATHAHAPHTRTRHTRTREPRPLRARCVCDAPADHRGDCVLCGGAV